MADIDKDNPNAEQIEFWNGPGGEKFIRFQTAIDAMVEQFGTETIRRIGLKSGADVLDVGCGCGDTTIDLARRVGAKGDVLGVDISEIMLARAEDAAAHAEITNVFFEVADVETSPLHEDSFDVAFSRFGVMFFKHPEVAFGNVYKALRKDGRIGFACWQPLPKNGWVFTQIQAVMPFIAKPPPPPDPEDPGPFSFGDPGRVRRILEGAGFRDIEIEPFDPDITVGATHDLDDAVEFAVQIGPVSALLAEADDEAKAGALAAVRDAFASRHTSRGVVLPSAAWIVTATK